MEDSGEPGLSGLRPLFVGGILLIAIGLAVLGIDNISFTHKTAVIDSGPIKVTDTRPPVLHAPSIAAVIAVVAGVAMVFFGRPERS